MCGSYLFGRLILNPINWGHSTSGLKGTVNFPLMSGATQYITNIV
ncbi:hypothetical protein GDI1085 [Gluconacetobacter diazotrophicus PA1 5]|uniref:Uncharacterized protein n=1 Tax=Gluconacetobacter diazotrophicus (strain ATCC 49037 / DSM 5601 / CCUG 37298 / CIP 103539 / LMG 7603 / PAl5) TaxID=272568 RepID=A9HD08_GLUDA|nr:hypothetical protein GDI1085 [Gluconacetobacter diazotrophicus PA1 5]